jgi:hypothetical protein
MKIENVLAFSISICLALGVFACSYLTPPMENPSIADEVHGISTYATIPSRRLVVIKQLKNNNNEIADYFVCGEPPADVSDNIASALTTALTAKGSVEQKASAELAANLSKTLNTTAQNMFKRTQGVQFYRDAMYSLCLAKMNKTIDEKQYKEMADNYANITFALIAAELKYLPTTKAEDSAKEAAVLQNAAADAAKEAKTAAAEALISAQQAKQAAKILEPPPKKE